MKTNPNDDKDFVNLILLIIALVIIAYLGSSVDAYVISRNRITYVPDNLKGNISVSASVAVESKTLGIKDLPDSLTLNKETLQRIFACHATDGGAGYQYGYSDACDWIRDLIGLKKSQFKSRPAIPEEDLLNKASKMISFPITNEGYFKINASEYRFEYMRKGSPRWPKSMNEYNYTVNDYWRVWPDHHTQIRNITPDFGLTYEELENGSIESL
jgi:hypothetical protein